MSQTIDLLMVTYQAPESTRIALGRLLETCDESMRVWLWHNGDHAETLGVVRSFLEHPRVHRFHHSTENKRLWEPTNWLLEHAEGDFLGKVDDDNVLPSGWTEPLIAAHNSFDRFGAIGCWRFQPEDFVPELANRKIREFPGGHRLLQNLWVEGSCFLMKRACRDRHGLLKPGQTFTRYLRDLALEHGWIHGWYYPFIHYENLDDPRCPNALVRTDEEFRKRLPLTAQYNGVSTMEEWTDQLRRSARAVQSASADPNDWRGWRQAMRSLRLRARKLVGIRNRW